MKTFSDRLNKIVPSASMKMAQRILEINSRGSSKVVDLTFGQPDFDTPEYIKEAAYKAIKEGRNGYTVSRGIPELRNAISDFYQNYYNVNYDPTSEILVAPGAKQGLMYVMQALLNDGEEVILFEPCWLSYRDMVFLNKGKPVFIKAKEGLTPDIDKLEESITDKTKVILINNPINPSGYVFTKEELEQVVEIAIANDLYIVADEIYDRIVFEKFLSLSSFSGIKDRLIIINGFSKTYAMTGWRIGYLLSCSDVISKVSLIHQHTATCAAAASQHAAVGALTGSQTSVDAMVQSYQRRRDLMCEGLKGSKFPIIKPAGTFYAMLDVSSLKVDPQESVEVLLSQYQLATVSGICYGESAAKYVRLSLTQDETQLMEVIERLRKS